jgi:hypothetical protein
VPSSICVPHRLLPGGLRRIERGIGTGEALVERFRLGQQLRATRRLRRVRHVERRFLDPVVATLLAEHRVLDVVEERHEAVVVALRERIVLVVVALCAGEGSAQPDRGRRVHAIDERLPARFLDVDAAFLVEERVAVEAAGDELVRRGVGQHVAGDLLDGEPVERQVRIERADHPVAIFPHRPQSVLFVAVAVGVSGEVEPDARPALAVVR